MTHVTVEWDNEQKTILRWEFAPGWSWDDFRAGRAAAESLLSSVPHTVDVIFDLNKSPVPKGNAIAQFRAATRNLQPNVGIRVVADADGFALTMLRMGIKVLNVFQDTPMIFVDSVEAARKVVSERRASRE